MSVDFNSVMSKAFSEAQRRKNIGNAAGFVEVDGVTKSAESQGSELSVTDIANAMKAGRVKKEEDNNFIATNGRGFKVIRDDKKDDKVNEVSPASMQAQERVNQMQNKITAIQNTAEVAVDRQNNIASSLRSYRDPFIK